MSKRSISMTLATMTAALTVGANPAIATTPGLSAAQVRAIVRQEVAKLPRIAGPRGPAGGMGSPGATGPAGMDGFPALSAHVSSDGGVIGNGTFGGGITEDNVRAVGKDIHLPNGQVRVDIKYCFTGLPPLTGGQVTVFGDDSTAGRLIPNLHVEGTGDTDPDCPTEVIVFNPQGHRVTASFYILLY